MTGDPEVWPGSGADQMSDELASGQLIGQTVQMVNLLVMLSHEPRTLEGPVRPNFTSVKSS